MQTLLSANQSAHTILVILSIITSAGREVKDSRRSGMSQSCFLGTTLGTQSQQIFGFSQLFDEVRAELVPHISISRSLRVLTYSRKK